MCPLLLYIAVMHCEKTEFKAVYFLAQKLLSKGVYFNTTTFTDNPVLKATFEAATEKLGGLISAAKGNTAKRKERDEQSVVVFNYMFEELPYVNKVADHNITIINLSGFDSNVLPTAHPLAPKVVIKDIVKGTQPHTAKVKIGKLGGEEIYKKEKRTYLVYVFADITTEMFDIGCAVTNSRKMIVENVPYMVTKYYAVVILNAAGKNEMSAKMKFTLTD